MAPESERAKEVCRCGHDWEHHVGDHCCGAVTEPDTSLRVCNCRNWRPKPAPAVAENSPAPHEMSEGQTNPNEPTLTCSEVVERLRNECLGQFYRMYFDDAKAQQILHSWRERRVQELEAAIRNFGYWLDEDQVSMWCKVCDAGKGTQHARIYGVDTKDWGPCPVGQAEDSEQIRKGAKHESDL